MIFISCLAEESTIQTPISRVNCYFLVSFDDVELQKITSRLITKFYAQIDKKNLSAEIIHKIHAIINNSFKRTDEFFKLPKIIATVPKSKTKLIFNAVEYFLNFVLIIAVIRVQAAVACLW